MSDDVVDYAIDFDILVNSISKTLHRRMWGSESEEYCFRLCLSFIHGIGAIAAERKFSVGVAMSPELVLAYLYLFDARLNNKDSIVRHHVQQIDVVNHKIDAETVSNLWINRANLTGHWIGKSKEPLIKIQERLEEANRVYKMYSQWNSIPNICYHLFELGKSSHSGKHYASIQASYHHLLLHLESNGDFSLDESRSNAKIALDENSGSERGVTAPARSGLYTKSSMDKHGAAVKAQGSVQNNEILKQNKSEDLPLPVDHTINGVKTTFVTHPMRMRLDEDFVVADALVACVDKMTIDGALSLLETAKISVQKGDAIFIHGVGGTGVPADKCDLLEKSSSYFSRTDNYKLGESVIYRDSNWIIFIYKSIPLLKKRMLDLKIKND